MGLLAFLLLAGGWPAFRGDNGSGVGNTVGLPAEFGPAKNVLWKVSLPQGTSSPIAAGGRIHITGHESGALTTFALDARTGEILWRRSLDRPRAEKLHKLNSPASSTPVTDGTNVYVFFGDFGLVSYGPDGNERWRAPLGPFTNLHGMGASPVLAGGNVIMLCDQDVGSFLLALDKDTGRQAWRVERPAVVHGFATPTLFTPEGGSPQVVVPGSYLLTSHDAATGRELWSVRGLSWQIKTTAVTREGVIYVTGWAPGADPGQARPLPPFEEAAAKIDANRDGRLSQEEVNPSEFRHSGSWRAVDLDDDGYWDKREWGFYRARRSARNLTMAVRPGNARGDLTDTHVLWTNDRFVPQVSSPLLYEGVLYIIKDGGIFTSMDPKSGKIFKTARIPGAIDNYYSSPVAADGKVFLASETGKVTVVKPGAEWEVVAVHDFEENIYATPALLEGRIYLRTSSTLYCLGKKAD